MGKLLGGGGLLFLALFMLLGFLNAAPKTSGAVTAFTFLIAVVLPATGSAALFYSHCKQRGAFNHRKERLRQQTLEAEILKLAARKGGKLTVVEVVGEAAVDAETAKRALDSLATQSLASLELTDSGVLVYAFYDIQHLPEKHSAKDVLDA